MGAASGARLAGVFSGAFIFGGFGPPADTSRFSRGGSAFVGRAGAGIGVAGVFVTAGTGGPVEGGLATKFSRFEENNVG